MRFQLTRSLMLAVFALASFSAEAAVCTSVIAGNWNTAATWNCGHVPVAADSVVVATNVTGNVATTITDLTVNSGVTLTLTSTPLTVTGNITNNGTITGAGSQIVQSTGNAAVISGAGTFSGSVRLYTAGTGPSIASGSNLIFAGTTQIRAGRNGGTAVAGSVLTINGTLNLSPTTVGATILRLYANSTVIGSTGILNAANSTITYNVATAKVTNNGTVTAQKVTQNNAGNGWVQGINSSLTVSAASTFGTATSATTGLNALATGNTVTFNTPATPVAPWSNTYYNLAGTGVSCPVPYTILGTSPCVLPPGVFSITRSPGTCANVTGIGTIAWATPGNALASDNVYTTAANVIRSVTTNYLQCTGYGFAIPVGSTILGIGIGVERKTSGGTIRDAAMRTVKAGAIGTTDRSSTTNYTTADVIEVHGAGSTDLWGNTWAPADINATNFGAAFAAKNTSTTSNTNRTVSVDHMPITVYYSTPSIHHIEIDHPGSGTICSPTTVAVKACGDVGCTLGGLFTGGASVTLTPGGNVVTIGASGIGSGTVASGTAGATTLSAASMPAAANATTCFNTVLNAYASCINGFTFNSAAINLSVPDGVSGNNVTGTIAACPATGAFTGPKTINFYTSYANPVANPVVANRRVATINGTAIATGAPGTAINLTFSPSSAATFTLAYPDVGQVTLTASYAGTPTLSNGVASFIMKPAGFVLSNIRQTAAPNLANPGAATAGGLAFVKAGEDFSVTVTAVNAAGAATPNYGNETRQESVKLTPALVGGLGLTNVPPIDRPTTGSIISGSNILSVTNITGYAIGDRLRIVGADVGAADLYTTITGITPGTAPAGTFTLATAASTSVSLSLVHYTFGAFAAGVATGSNFTWDEVGIITLLPSISDANYLTAGNVIGNLAGSPSGNVGRFTLAKFKLLPQAQEDRADICNLGVLISDGVTPCPAFTYMGEEFDASFTLQPMSLNNVALQNYTGQNGANDFAKLDPRVFTNLNLAAVDRATTGQPYYLSSRLSNAGMPLVTCASTPCFPTTGAVVADVSVPLIFSRGASPDGAYTAADIGIAPLDGDGAPVDAIGTAGANTCNNTTVAACYDMDSDTVAGNDHAKVASTEFRYGRTRISNAFGSELLSLVMPLAVEYWNSGSYVASANDSISLVTVVLGNWQRNLTAGSTTATVSAINMGSGQVMLTAPGAGKNGSVDVTTNTPSYLPGKGTATFGVYKGGREFIYLRESY